MSKAIHVRVTTFPHVGNNPITYQNFAGEDPKKVLETAIVTLPETVRNDMRKQFGVVVEGERDAGGYVKTPGATYSISVDPVEIVS